MGSLGRLVRLETLVLQAKKGLLGPPGRLVKTALLDRLGRLVQSELLDLQGKQGLLGRPVQQDRPYPAARPAQ